MLDRTSTIYMMFDEIKGNKIVYRSDYTYRIGNILIYHYENLKYSYSTFKLSITLHTIKANKTIVNNIYYLINIQWNNEQSHENICILAHINRWNKVYIFYISYVKR